MHCGLANRVWIGVDHDQDGVSLTAVVLGGKVLGVNQYLRVIAVVRDDVAKLFESRVLLANLVQQRHSRNQSVLGLQCGIPVANLDLKLLTVNVFFGAGASD